VLTHRLLKPSTKLYDTENTCRNATGDQARYTTTLQTGPDTFIQPKLSELTASFKCLELGGVKWPRTCR